MRFSDEAIRIRIIDKNNQTYSFKSFIEKSEVSYKIEEQSLPFTPVGLVNGKLSTRLLYNIDLAFDVFSEDRKEAIENWKKFNSIVGSLRPSYVKIGDEIELENNGLEGLLYVEFAGLPPISGTGSRYKVRPTNFSYSVNKEMGYIEVPYYGSEDEINNFYLQGKMSLIPVAFKINLAGFVITGLEAAINDTGGGSGGPGPPSPGGNGPLTVDQAWGGANELLKSSYVDTFEKVTGKQWDPPSPPLIVEVVKQARIIQSYQASIDLNREYIKSIEKMGVNFDGNREAEITRAQNIIDSLTTALETAKTALSKLPIGKQGK
jgi:hypothetical protein